MLRTEEEQKLTKKERNALAAIRDPVLMPNIPNVKPLFPGRTDAWEPIQTDESKKRLESPVFLVDPLFTKKVKEEKRIRFNANDFGGHKQPIQVSAWPIAREQIQKYFGVGKDCTCSETGKALADLPYIQWNRAHVHERYAPFWEPSYQDTEFKFPKNMQYDCYKGDDWGGHNIPNPAPAPPKPASSIYSYAYVDFSKMDDDAVEADRLRRTQD